MTVSLLARVRMFLDKEAGDRKVLCNYDCRQNAPIESLNNVPSGYYERVLGNLFPIQIHLDTNKTVDTRQHQRLQDMEADLFVAELNPMQFCSKWFREVQERDISRGPRYITLENTTMSRINNGLSDRRGSQILLHVGQLWRCREHFDQAEAKSVVNLTYKLTALEATRCHLVSMSGLHELSVSRSSLLGSFEPPYASTCHSMQAMRSFTTLMARRTQGSSAKRRRFWGVGLGRMPPFSVPGCQGVRTAGNPLRRLV